MDNKLVSVIVLTYKNFDNIEENLNSIFSQTYKEIEIIISDDGSINFDIEKIKELTKKAKQNIKNIKIIHHEKNIGTVKNFNKAIKKSNGQYIIPLAQDDCFYSQNVIENIINKFGEYFVVTGIREIYLEKKRIGELPLKKDRKRFNESNFYEFLILNGNIVSGACTYYKREIFEKYGYFDEDLILLEDMPFYLRLLSNSEKIKFLDLKTIKYSLGGISTSEKQNPILTNDWIKLYEKEKKEKSGYLKRYINFLLDIQMNILKNRNIKFSYLKFPDILIFKVTEKIFKINILFKIYKIK